MSLCYHDLFFAKTVAAIWRDDKDWDDVIPSTNSRRVARELIDRGRRREARDWIEKGFIAGMPAQELRDLRRRLGVTDG